MALMGWKIKYREDRAATAFMLTNFHENRGKKLRAYLCL
jgi:hypothetical protein